MMVEQQMAAAARKVRFYSLKNKAMRSLPGDQHNL